MRFHLLLLVSGLGLLVWSGIGPRDRTTWMLEVAPAVAGTGVLLATYRRFRLSNLAYVLIWIHAAILIIGGHWTYEHNPLFNALRDALGLHRNYYDRLGHVAQGFIPVILAREVLLRTSPLRPGGWLNVLSVCVCLALSAVYEFFEWWTALSIGEAADQFLATQGDVWDTQWDMFLCLCGATASLLTLRRAHDRSLAGAGIRPRTRTVVFLAAVILVGAGSVLACRLVAR